MHHDDHRHRRLRRRYRHRWQFGADHADGHDETADDRTACLAHRARDDRSERCKCVNERRPDQRRHYGPHHARHAGFTPQSATTAADGSGAFTNLLDGFYDVSADRTLTPTELARLSPADRDASLFAGGRSAVVSPPVNATATIAMVANRRGSLVISEMFPYNNPMTTGLGYGIGDYLELYNNSDNTI